MYKALLLLTAVCPMSKVVESYKSIFEKDLSNAVRPDKAVLIFCHRWPL